MFKKNKNVPALLGALHQEYANVTCELTHDTPFQLLVATILSAQCTDKRVNMVTPGLFKKYPTPEALAAVSQQDLEKIIRSTGFYRNKAKNIRNAALMLVKQFQSRVPSTMSELLELPGVARKTANVVLGTAFKKAVGVVVDTHVMRLSNRLGLSQKKTPEKIEQELMTLLPPEKWVWFSHALIHHGRRVCLARSPRCVGCPLRVQCANPVN